MAKMADDPFADSAEVPIIADPADLIIVVIGGFGRHSSWLPTFGGSTVAITRPIADTSGTPIRSVLDLR